MLRWWTDPQLPMIPSLLLSFLLLGFHQTTLPLGILIPIPIPILACQASITAILLHSYQTLHHIWTLKQVSYQSAAFPLPVIRCTLWKQKRLGLTWVTGLISHLVMLLPLIGCLQGLEVCILLLISLLVAKLKVAKLTSLVLSTTTEGIRFVSSIPRPLLLLPVVCSKGFANNAAG